MLDTTHISTKYAPLLYIIHSDKQPVLVIGALLAGLWTVIQIVESETFKNIFGSAGEAQVEEQVNPSTQPGEDADSARVAGEGVDTTDAVHQ